MPLAQISCFCTNKEGEEGDTEWSVLPACGHLFHTVCIRPRSGPPLTRRAQSCITKWFEIPDELGRPKKKPVCPNCRKEVNTVTIKLQGKARVPLGPIRLFFVGSPLSDPASQMTQDSHLTRSRVGMRADRSLMGDVDDEIEASPEPEEQARLNPLAASERERKRLLRQHNDLLASHRVVAAERAALATRVKEMEGQVTLLKDSEKALKEEVEGLELSLDGLQDERDDDDGYPGGLSEKELRDTLQLEINSQAEELDDLRGELQGVLHELRVAGQAWDAKETEYVVERDRLKEKLSREGNSGGQRIKTLMIELNEAHAAHDRCVPSLPTSLTTRRYKKSSSAAFNLAQRTHEMAIKDLEEKLDGRTRLIDNAKAGETQALLLRDKAEEKARRLESANESWTIKVRAPLLLSCRTDTDANSTIDSRGKRRPSTRPSSSTRRRSGHQSAHPSGMRSCMW